MHLVCPSCAATNRVPDDRLRDDPVCGRCGIELAPARPVELSDASHAAYVGRSEAPVLVDYWAAWCGPCRAMAPQFAAAAAQLPAVRFAKLDTDAHPAASAAAAIRSIPTFVLYRGGRELARHSGVMPAAELLRWLRQRLGTPEPA